MAKKKAPSKKSLPAGRTAQKASAPARKEKTIKPPAAPPLIHSAEAGAPMALDRAIAEKLRLYPLASVKEIVAMFELDGVKVTPAAVKKAQERLA